MVVVGLVAEVDQGGERGALARARGAGHEKQAAGPADEFLAD